MTVAQEIAALQEQCKVLEGDRDPTARAALLHKRAEIKRLQRQAIARQLGYVSQPTVCRILRAERALSRGHEEPETAAQNPGEDEEVSCDETDLTQQPSRGRLEVSVTVYMETAQFAALKALSKRTRVPYAEYIRNGVDLVLADPTATVTPQPQAEPTSAELRCLEWLAGRMEVWGPTLVSADNRQMVTELLQRVHAVLGRGDG